MPDLSEAGSVTHLEAQLFAERGRLTRDAFLNSVGYALGSVAGMVLLPFLLHGLSRELYGVWIASLALQSTFSFLNGGLGRGVAREVAASMAAPDEDATTFVRATGVFYVVIAAAGMLIIASVGLPLGTALHVSAENLRIARLVFLFAGAAFFGDQVQSFALEILTGLRRFTTMNLINIGAVVVRAAGIILLIASGHSILTIAIWHALTALGTGFINAALALHFAPRFRPTLQGFKWRRVRKYVEFGLASQITSAASNLLWRSTTFLVGFTRGPAAIVPYEVGQKFPLSVSAIIWQASDVMFPAASEYHRGQRAEHTRQLLVVGTRGVLFLVVPASLILWMLAPHLFTVWVGTRLPDSVAILRLTILAVAADCAAAICVQLLWAQGQVRSVLKVTILALALSVGLGWPLLLYVGVVGAAAGLAFSIAVSAACYFHLAARSCRCTLAEVLGPALSELWKSSALCAVTIFCMMRLHSPDRWPFLALTAGVALFVYCSSFYLLDAHDEEKAIAREALSATRYNINYAWRRLWSA